MNPAAEKAVPQAQQLLLDAVRKMTVQTPRRFSPAVTIRLPST